MAHHPHTRLSNDDQTAQPPPATTDQPQPVVDAERVTAIDVLRGVALLGIFPINIVTFALASWTFFDPTVDGGFTGADRFAWLAGHLLFELKMMGLFSLLFGAGLLIFIERARQKTQRPLALTARRLLFLLAFGLIHAYLIWEGDILVSYAVTGLVLLAAHAAFRLLDRHPAVLITLGLALLPVALLFSFAQGALFDASRDAMLQAESIAAEGDPVPPEIKNFAQVWRDAKQGFVATPEALAEERAGFLGSYTDRLPARATASFFIQLWVLPTFIFWRVAGLMLIGAALYKLGMLSAKWSTRAYALTTLLGFAIGIPAAYLGYRHNLAADFDAVALFKTGWIFNYTGSLAVIAGWIGLVMLVVRTNTLGILARALAAVGRTAFSNYILQSLIGFTLFYGTGFALHGKLSRTELWLVVFAVWTLQLLISPLWLARFRFGPLEWLWRRLTYAHTLPARQTAS